MRILSGEDVRQVRPQICEAAIQLLKELRGPDPAGEATFEAIERLRKAADGFGVAQRTAKATATAVEMAVQARVGASTISTNAMLGLENIMGEELLIGVEGVTHAGCIVAGLIIRLGGSVDDE